MSELQIVPLNVTESDEGNKREPEQEELYNHLRRATFVNHTADEVFSRLCTSFKTPRDTVPKVIMFRTLEKKKEDEMLQCLFPGDESDQTAFSDMVTLLISCRSSIQRRVEQMLQKNLHEIVNEIKSLSDREFAVFYVYYAGRSSKKMHTEDNNCLMDVLENEASRRNLTKPQLTVTSTVVVNVAMMTSRIASVTSRKASVSSLRAGRASILEAPATRAAAVTVGRSLGMLAGIDAAIAVGVYGGELLYDFYRYSVKKEISWAVFIQTAKRTVAAGVLSTICSIGGGIAGGTVGSCMGPLGTMIGFVLGSFIGGICGDYIGRVLVPVSADNDPVIDHPDKDEIVLEALRALDLDGVDTTNVRYSDVKKRYHALIRVHHPDKGGDAKQFIEITAAFAILRRKYGSVAENSTVVSRLGIDRVKLELQLADIVGQHKLKEVLREFAEGLRIDSQRDRRSTKQKLHMALLGNPDTGKTTTAKVIHWILRSLGFVNDTFLAVGRSDLVGNAAGATALRTRDIIQKAKGGVLFVKEAHSLVQQLCDEDFGRDALVELMKDMEGGDPVIIFAGCERETRNFIWSYDGLHSLITKLFVFENLNVDDLVQIVMRLLSDRGSFRLIGYRKEKCDVDLLRERFKEKLDNHSDVLRMYNGRIARDVLDEAIRMQYTRIRAELREKLPPNHKRSFYDFEVEDFSQALDVVIKNLKPSDSQEGTLDMLLRDPSVANNLKLYTALKELQEMTGMHSMKDGVATLVHRYLRTRGRWHQSYNHIELTGPPGTGKSYAAKRIADVLIASGLVPGEYVEVKQSDLIGSHEGDTQKKMDEFVAKMKGNVIFLDEAHSLGCTHEYAVIVATGLNQFLNNNSDTIVIVAGYKEELEKGFFDLDGGLRRRFQNRFHTEEYSPKELVDMMIQQFGRANIAIPNESVTRDALQRLVSDKIKLFEDPEHPYGGGTQRVVDFVEYMLDRDRGDRDGEVDMRDVELAFTRLEEKKIPAEVLEWPLKPLPQVFRQEAENCVARNNLNATSTDEEDTKQHLMDGQRATDEDQERQGNMKRSKPSTDSEDRRSSEAGEGADAKQELDVLWLLGLYSVALRMLWTLASFAMSICHRCPTALHACCAVAVWMISRFAFSFKA
eukprot:scaffold2687_cov305-Pinguiococcus_pyrenoidosus.AAC.4